jgi:nucleotide-binding universal stress UspA family protein
MAEAELESEGAKDVNVTWLLGAGGNARLESQRLAVKAAETQGRLRWAVGQRLMSDARARAKQTGVQKVCTITRAGDPAREILSLAREQHANLIIMGRRGLGDLAGLLLGSVSQKVTQLAECA